MEINPANLRGLFTLFSTRWNQAYGQTQTWWDQVASEEPSSSSENDYAFMQRVPAMREWLGDRVSNALAAYDFTIKNKNFEGTYEIDKFRIQDDQYGIYSRWFDEAGRQAKKLPDYLMASLMINGQSNPCYDGQNFFSTSHPVNLNNANVLSPAGSNVQSNYYTGTALNPTNYQTVRQNMMSWVGEDGKPMGIVPDTLVYDPSLEGMALQILNAEIFAPNTYMGQTNVGSMTNVLKGTAKPLMVPELASDPGGWYLIDSKRSIKPFVWQLRQAPFLTPRTSPTDDNVFWDHKWVIGTEGRGNAGYALWWLCAKAHS